MQVFFITLLMLCGVSEVRAESELDSPLPFTEDGDEVTGRLEDGMRIPVTIDGSRGYETFVVEVPRNVKSMRLVLRGEGADLDLYAKRGGIIETLGDADHSATSNFASEQLYLRRGGGLKKGLWYIDVYCPSGRDIEAVLEVDFNVDEIENFYDQVMEDALVVLEPGVWQPGKIDRALAPYQTFRFTVPEGVSRMYVQTRAAQYDIDLYLREGAQMDDWDSDPDYEAVTARLDENLFVEAKGGELATSDWYLDVVTLRDSDSEIEYEIQVSFDTPPEDENLLTVPMVPDPPEALSVLERALWSTVKIDADGGSGSGSLVSADGLIITNHHVVYDDESNEVNDTVYVSLAYAMDQPPAQRLIAKTLEYDEDLDLALLQIQTNLAGDELPEDTTFYFVPLGDSQSIRLGQPIWVGGYPSVGGRNSRSPVSLTSGIMSGWDNTTSGEPWIKTDARINAGNSGGSMFDSSGNLIGIPTMERIEEDDELGYARPTHVIPAGWLSLINGTAPADDKSMPDDDKTEPAPEPASDTKQ
jgi:hypothetical protein